MNNFNNQFNNMNKNGMNGLPMGAMMGTKTNSAIKFMVVLLLGVLPLLICSLLITDPNMTDQFKQWGPSGPKNASIHIDYGFMWLIGIALYIAIFPVIYLITGLTKEVKMDVMPATSAAGLAMLNMFVIPHTSAWFLILSLPSFAIIGFIIGLFVMLVIIVKKINKQMNDLQKNPEFKKMMDQFQGKQGANGAFGNNKPNNDYKSNPFVDIPNETKEEDKEEDEE